jgi:hypothetical protein
MADPKAAPKEDTAAKDDTPAKAESKAAPKEKTVAERLEDSIQVSFTAASESPSLTRSGATKAQYEELSALGVNPQLDNRTGDQRPTLPTELLPQQVDGPEVGGLAVDASELADKARPSRKGDFKVLGNSSAGPLGRGE